MGQMQWQTDSKVVRNFLSTQITHKGLLYSCTPDRGCWLPGGMCLEAFDMERSRGEEGVGCGCWGKGVMVCGAGRDLLPSSAGYPCAVCRADVGNNGICCSGCKLLVHGDSGVQSRSDLISWRWWLPSAIWMTCFLLVKAVTARVKIACKKFRELLPVLTSRHLSYKTRGHVCSSCAGRHAPCRGAWPLARTGLRRSGGALVGQVCSVKPGGVATVRSGGLLVRLGLGNLSLILRERRFAGLGMWNVLVVQEE